jgi:nucleoside-diphosphate-sugar epimerase
LEVIHGSISDQETVQKAMKDITHVVHLATPKEDPETIMDVAIKGLFWLLESCRESNSFKRFILIGGDASVGHYFYPYKDPITENQAHAAYPGCYALSKVLEETMLQQYFVQYDLDGTCLRASWIMERSDLKKHLSFGNQVFGVPEWHKMVMPQTALEYEKENLVPLMLDINGNPMKRNMVHLNDLVAAICLSLDHMEAKQQTFNISMREPFDYGKAAHYLLNTRKIKSVPMETKYHSTWLDVNKANFLLGWRPAYGLEQMIDEAWGL